MLVCLHMAIILWVPGEPLNVHRVFLQAPSGVQGSWQLQLTGKALCGKPSTAHGQATWAPYQVADTQHRAEVGLSKPGQSLPSPSPRPAQALGLSTRKTLPWHLGTLDLIRKAVRSPGKPERRAGPGHHSIPGRSLCQQGRGDKVGRGVAGGLRPAIQARSNHELNEG